MDIARQMNVQNKPIIPKQGDINQWTKHKEWVENMIPVYSMNWNL